MGIYVLCSLIVLLHFFVRALFKTIAHGIMVQYIAVFDKDTLTYICEAWGTIQCFVPGITGALQIK